MDRKALFRDVQSLVKNESKGPCVSIFADMQTAGIQKRQNFTRLKNLLREASRRISEEWELDEAFYLNEAYRLLENEIFLQHQDEGLAFYIDAESTRWYRLPLNFQDAVYIGQYFEIRPIVELLQSVGTYYVLCLSQDNCCLYKANDFGLTRLDLGDTPTSIEEALWFDDMEPSLQYHTGTTAVRPRMKKGTLMTHGQGFPSDFKKDRIARFFQRLEAGVTKKLNGSEKPLVLAGVENLKPIYREVNKYSRLLDKGIDRHPGALSEDEIHDKTQKLMRDGVKEKTNEVLERLGSLLGTGKASRDIATVVQETFKGRVGQLVVSTSTASWGRFNPQSFTVAVNSSRQANDHDLVNLAAVGTLANGGELYIVDQGETGAIFRY